MTEHDEFERELTGAMVRVEAPATFLDGVMEAAGWETPAFGGRVLAFPHRYKWVGSVAASLLLTAGLLGALEHHRAVERVRAERDFARAKEVTDRAMEHTRQQLQRAGIALD